MGPSLPSRIAVFCLLIAVAALAPRTAVAITFNADVTYTSDYIYRGVSQTGGRPAGQLDLHMATSDGTFVGVFASTLNRTWHREYITLGWNYELQEYIGHRFDLSPAWSTTLTGVSYQYKHGNVPLNNDYQELSVAVSYLDSWTLTVAYSPNAVRFQSGYRLGRYPAYSVDSVTQLPLLGRLFLTAGVGYYVLDSDDYFYGNAGLAFEFKGLRIDAGYYAAQERAQILSPYGRAGSRFAGSVSWHF
ncbi:MAG: hypothetical protein JSR66_02410 [Proteobacteria bacterium]|nr:hypothetical protein [Pseudomonadota bacterium]